MNWRCLTILMTLGLLMACTPSNLDDSQTTEEVPGLTPALSQSAFAPQIVADGDLSSTDVSTPAVAETLVPTETSVPTMTATATATSAATETPEPTASPTPTPTPTAMQSGLVNLEVNVLAEYPHDVTVFSQGLHYESGVFYESGGLYNESSVRIVNLADGSASLVVDLPNEVFGEGLAKVGDQLIQLTWRAGIAYIWNAADLSPLGEYTYEGEGWGLCYDGEFLWMSSGSEILQKRDANTFELIDSIAVLLDGEPLVNLNELECAEGDVFANIWFEDEIARIDKMTGEVKAIIDASALLTLEEREALGRNDVLNGIAYNPEDGIYYLTGKRWPKLFAVEFVEVAE